MITRVVICKFGTLTFQLKESGWQVSLKQGGHFSFLQSTSLAYNEVQSLEGLIDLYVRLHGLGEIERDFIRLKLHDSDIVHFEVHKTCDENIVCISRVYKRWLYRNFYIRSSFYDIDSLIYWCKYVLSGVVA